MRAEHAGNAAKLASRTCRQFKIRRTVVAILTVRGIDPETGFYFDDTKRYIDNARISQQEKANIFEHNIRKVFSRIKI